MDYRRQVREAHTALDGGSNRRESGLVRAAFARIVFRFRREKKARRSHRLAGREDRGWNKVYGRLIPTKLPSLSRASAHRNAPTSTLSK